VGGHQLVDHAGRSWLIDASACGGHGEFDLATMGLFGGFGAAAFTGDDEFPLADRWEHGVPLHLLAPLLVHAVKFGDGYRSAVARVTAVRGAVSPIDR
jgi:fructosamine-3-kinase